MTRETAKRFIGKAIVVDPRTGADAECSAYVYVLLTGTAGVPSVTFCEALSFDGLMERIVRDEIAPHFRNSPLTFEPPSHRPLVSHSMMRQRYEALSLDEIGRAQTLLSGR